MSLISGMQNHPLGSKSEKQKTKQKENVQSIGGTQSLPMCTTLEGIRTTDLMLCLLASLQDLLTWMRLEGLFHPTPNFFFVEKVRDFFLQFCSGMGVVSLAWSLGTRLCWIHWVHHHLSGIHDVLLFSTYNAKMSMAGFHFTRKEVIRCPKWTNFNQ